MSPAGTAALVLVALVALWFCVRATLTRWLERDYPVVGQVMSPPSPISQALIALNRASARNGVADPLARDLLEKALRRAPLLAEPLIVAGLDASARDDLPRAEQLMNEASRRDPRAIIPRYWLFDNYLRNGDYVRGIAEAGPLMRIQPAAGPATVAVLTALLRVPAARAPLVAALRGRPAWRGDFFAQAAASPNLRDEAATMLNGIASGGPVSAGQEHRSIMAALVGAGRYRDAYTLWLRTLPAGDRPATPGLYDGGFTGRAGTPPFGWRLPGMNRGSTRIVRAPDAPSGSGLAIQAEGDRPAVLAEQLILAKPGSVRLGYAVRALNGEAAGSAGLQVQLRCAGRGGKVLASQRVEAFTPRLQTRTLDAVVPPGCGAVMARVSVAPSIEPGPVEALLTAMSLKN